MSTQRTRGRRPAHPELKRICSFAATCIKFDGGEDRAEIYQADALTRGVTPCTWASAIEDRWFIKFSMGGKQFTLGAFALYEATRIYDAMFVFFREYRVRMPDEQLEKAWLNWPRKQAEDDIADNGPLIGFLKDLKDFWLRAGYLKSAESRADVKTQRAKAYERRRSTAGMVETWGGDLRTILFEMQDKLDTVEKKLDEIRRCVTIPTIEVPPTANEQMETSKEIKT